MDKQRRLNILLIESSAHRLGLIRDELKQAETRCRLHTVGIGADSMKYLKRETPFDDAPRPDLVIADLSQPSKRLMTFVEKLKSAKEFANLPLVVMTRPETEALLEEKYPADDGCVMFSPIELGSFLTTMNSMPVERFLNAVRLIADLGFVLVRTPDHFDEESTADNISSFTGSSPASSLAV